ncbi:2,3-bisphosphoglycerate-independent phosphoglycerate mutase [Rickettsiales bacterium]|nr:2,3-bisphosphoglycerate-independent phosphoglycerate mutase [Rickettsiales bacterium]
MLNNNKNNTKKPIMLCILDGWGIGEENPKTNAIFKAKTPNYDTILSKYPHSQIKTSGTDVGLPDGQIGNSEVGHITIGSGRVIYQDLPRINNSITNNELRNHTELQKLIKNCRNNNKPCHILGLFSDGGVHAHQDHIMYLAKTIAKEQIEVKIHAFLDGRDVEQKHANIAIEKFKNEIKDYLNIKISTISGRFYAMDRDNKWDRTKLAYDAIVNGKGKIINNLSLAISESYQQDITDEFIEPTIIEDSFNGINDGDAILIANFRSDRIRQISQAIIDPDFKEFKRKNINFCAKISMTEYSKNLNNYFSILFPAIRIKNSLPRILADNNLTQLRIAETEKYAHVTFFFSGGREEEHIGEDRILIESPNVRTYDLKPEMSAINLGQNLVNAIKSNKYDFIVVNYANPDMVGHSGVMDSAVKACETIDQQLKILEETILKQDGMMLITADHGNIENMITKNGKPHTAHTTNPVPLILIGNNISNISLKNGSLADLAPTILELLDLNKPKEVTGNSLLER